MPTVEPLFSIDYPYPESPEQTQQEITSLNALALVRAVASSTAAMEETARRLEDLDLSWLGDFETPEGLTKRLDVEGWLPNAMNSGVEGVDAPNDLAYFSADIGSIATAPAYSMFSIPFSFDENLWDTELLDAAKAKLLYDFANGGYGIEPQDEIPLWERARERELMNGETAMQEASRQVAARGFQLPPGALAAQLQKVQQDAMEKNSSVSREIALKRADLYVQNRQFTFQMAKEVEQVLIQYISAYYDRALKAAEAQLNAYNVSVAVYDAQVKAFMANLSAKETQLRMQTSLSDANVRIYMARISKYEAQLRQALGRASHAADVYKANIQRYMAQVDGVTKENELEVRQAEANARVIVARVQNNLEAIKAQIGALEAAAKLYVEPASALSGMAQAYIASMTNIAATIA